MSKTSKSENLEVQPVSPQVIESAPEYIFKPKAVTHFPCKVCGTSGATERSDGLCWVCRRLKISAWRESDAQESSGG